MASEIDTSVLTLIEVVVNDLLVAFDVTSPPVPVEIMLQRPKPNMWQQVNLGEISTTFINVSEPYGPRMSISRLLARHICRSEWGEVHGLSEFRKNDPIIYALARALLMPRRLIEAQAELRDPLTVSYHFGVPESAVHTRLAELNITSGTA